MDKNTQPDTTISANDQLMDCLKCDVKENCDICSATDPEHICCNCTTLCTHNKFKELLSSKIDTLQQPESISDAPVENVPVERFICIKADDCTNKPYERLCTSDCKCIQCDYFHACNNCYKKKCCTCECGFKKYVDICNKYHAIKQINDIDNQINAQRKSAPDHNCQRCKCQEDCVLHTTNCSCSQCNKFDICENCPQLDNCCVCESDCNDNINPASDYSTVKVPDNYDAEDAYIDLQATPLYSNHFSRNMSITEFEHALLKRAETMIQSATLRELESLFNITIKVKFIDNKK